MTEKDLQQLIKEFEQKMPPEIMTLIQTFEWRRELRTIAQQNQLMIDVGTDLEQSVYLMILGVVEAEEVYARLIDVHELSEDRSRKILEDLEARIFNPLYKKLTMMEAQDQKKEGILSQAQKAGVPESRDAILAEIEDKPVYNNPINDLDDDDTVLRSIPHPSAQIDTRDPRVAPLDTTSQTVLSAPIQAKSQEQQATSIPVQMPDPVGAAKPFSFDSKGDVVPAPQEAPSVPVFKMTPPVQKPETVTGITEDHIQNALQKSTAMKTEMKDDTSSTPPSKGYTNDPYREPIQ